MANKKFENFKEYRQLYPEYRFVFTGDSGQGDVILGGKILDLLKAEEKETKVSHQGEVTVLIHDIIKKTNPLTDQKGREALLANGIHLYDSYVTAALVSYQAELISEESLLYIMKHAQESFAQIHFTDQNAQKARLKELELAVDSCTKALEDQKKQSEQTAEKKDEEKADKGKDEKVEEKVEAKADGEKK